MSMEPKPEGGVVVFVLGLLGLLICAPLGIAAWIMGNNYMTKCREMTVEPEGLAVAGRILGIIATCLMVLVAAIWVLVICLGVAGGIAGG
jgi:hypothetical protein